MNVGQYLANVYKIYYVIWSSSLLFYIFLMCRSLDLFFYINKQKCE